MIEKVCSVDQCAGSVVARGWCGKHYARWRQHGDPSVVLPKSPPADPCRAEGCGEKGSEGFGYCRPHYKRFRRYGDPLGTPAPTAKPYCYVCGEPAKARLLCGAHYQRFRRTGSVGLTERTFEQVVWEKIAVAGPDECWEWQAARCSKSSGNHGQVWSPQAQRLVYAHRVVWEFANGELLDPYTVVRHTCDNPPCCNPAHLVAGTQADNVRDMVERGRAWWQKREPGSEGAA